MLLKMTPDCRRRGIRHYLLARFITGLVVAITLTLGGRNAWAVLGANASTVEMDRQQLAGQLENRSASGFSVSEITTPDGTKVREYIAPNGTVFGVSWRGPRVPNLSSLLGTYYSEYRENLTKASILRLHMTIVRTPNVVVETGGPMRAYWGRAFVPNLIPQGVSEDEIK